MSNLELFHVPALWDRFFVNALEHGTRQSVASHVPAVDIHETPEGYDFKFDLPGVDKDAIAIEVKDRYLTVTAERKSEDVDEKGNGFRRIERAYGKFYRRFEVPNAGNLENIKAAYKDGVLSLFVAKASEVKPRTIRID